MEQKCNTTLNNNIIILCFVGDGQVTANEFAEKWVGVNIYITHIFFFLKIKTIYISNAILRLDLLKSVFNN